MLLKHVMDLAADTNTQNTLKVMLFIPTQKDCMFKISITFCYKSSQAGTDIFFVVFQVHKYA